MTDADFTVIGAGVMGLAIALAWKQRHPAERVVVLDKEPALGAHASGRNSGVLHAGLYYPAGTLKAEFARDGNRAWTAWCLERRLPIRRCGKLVVAREAADHPQMDELLRRARDNGVPLEDLSAEDARRIEPRARTVDRALFAPETSSVDPGQVMASLAAAAGEAGVELRLGAGFQAREPSGALHTATGTFDPGFVVNAAGLQADRVAAAWGFGAQYRILPFRGLYLLGSDAAPDLRCHVYPVPDLDMPFLGVHFTVKVDGHVKIGPTAQPALWREQYGGWSGFSASELVEIGGLGLRKLLVDRRFRALAARELRHARQAALLDAARRLVPQLDAAAWTRWGPPGIRAQLVDRATGALVMDFVLEGDRDSFHVLNGISPGFTCALPFADHCVARIEAARA